MAVGSFLARLAILALSRGILQVVDRSVLTFQTLVLQASLLNSETLHNPSGIARQPYL